MPTHAPTPPSRSTFAKVAVLVAAGGVIACALLALRQARLQAFHETAASQLRLQRHEERVFEIRAEIGRRIMPQSVRQMATSLGEIESIGLPGRPRPMTVADNGLDDR
jgi:hypothetical protein